MKTSFLKNTGTALAVFLLLFFTACEGNTDGTNTADDAAVTEETTDQKYVYPAETVPVSPEQTKTEQDNTDVEKNYRKMVSEEGNTSASAKTAAGNTRQPAQTNSSKLIDKRAWDADQGKSSSAPDVTPLPEDMAEIDLTKVGDAWWEEEYVMPDAYYNFFLWDVMNNLPDATVYTEAYVAKRKNSSNKVYAELELLDRPPLFASACKEEKSKEAMLTCSNEAIQDFFQEADYPNSALRREKQSTTIVSFIVSAKGEVIDENVSARSKNGDCQICRTQAIEMVKNMDNWIPARRNGKAVATRLNLPVNYNLINTVRMK